MIGTLLKKEFKANLLILIIFMALLSMYSVIIVAMYDPKLGESMNMLVCQKSFLLLECQIQEQLF